MYINYNILITLIYINSWFLWINRHPSCTVWSTWRTWQLMGSFPPQINSDSANGHKSSKRGSGNFRRSCGTILGGAYGLLNEHLQLNARNGTGSEKGLDVFLGNIQHANNCDAEGKLIAHRNTTARSSSFFSRGSLTVLYCNYSLAAVGSVDPLCSAGLKNTV